MKKVIVLGNGFDLDLGWNTSYKQFFLTQYGSRAVTEKDDSLIQYIINHAGEKDTWYDLEKMLSDYCVLKSKEKRTEQQLLDDNLDYKELRNNLSEFENKVLELYLEGENYVSIAQVLNKSPKSIDNALQRIRQKLAQKK